MSNETKDVVKVPFPKVQGNDGVMGDIKINHSVVANIVRLAAQNVEGVHSVGGGFVEGITEIFSKKDSERGVRVSENEVGEYVIEVKVNLLFGYELAKVGEAIQKSVAQHVQRMTMKQVDRVDVIIDGVRNEPTPQAHKDEEDL
ncbi:MAG: Asp23/Gls24 family envelope stress response protein [Opitutales bacterium]